jgi:hypothetical protein
MTAASILAEIGPDMSPFETAKNLSKWVGICPGNNRTAGKTKHSRIDRGNKFLLAALVQAAWAAARKRDSIFQRKFHRWMRRLGEAKANVALAHSMLELIYAILKRRRPYQEPDPQQMHALEKTKLVHHHARRLQQLGADQTLVAELIARLRPAEACSSPEDKQTSTEQPPAVIRETCPPKVCRGALGFRARQTRPQQYSVKKDPSAGAPRQRRPASKNKTETQRPHPEPRVIPNPE